MRFVLLFFLEHNGSIGYCREVQSALKVELVATVIMNLAEVIFFTLELLCCYYVGVWLVVL